ncbi:MAG: lamin tail domain-containing protein, partial [Akkermansiaceae bacterium]|nr:lamin tail domain-containing protein [Akkermansiaceae bacterium]
MISAFIRAMFLAAMILPCQAEPIITELMADNQSTLADEDGDFSDWIEIHNPDSVPADLTGWKLTDDSENPAKWTFPAITLQPGEFRIFFASQKNATYPHHTNFKLAKSGEFLALVRPDSTIRQQFSPSYPSQGIDESYGLRFAHTTLVATGATAHYTAPAATIPAWETTGFNHAAWPQGPTGLGYGLTEPGITVRHVFKNGSIGGLTDAYSLLALPAGDPGILSETTVVSPTVNFLGEASDGHFAYNSPPPGGTGDHYAIEAIGFIHIPTAGYYTFGVSSDDGGSITIDGTAVMTDDSFHGADDHFGNLYLTSGTHTFRAVMFEGGGGDEFEFYAAAGQLAA